MDTTIKEVIQKLYISVGENEKALSKFIDSKAVEVQAFVGTDSNFPCNPSEKEIFLYSLCLNKTLEIIITKEVLGYKKMEAINYLSNYIK